MEKKVISIYKIPILISVTLSITLLALSTVRAFTDILAIFSGAFLGIFVLDLEYFVYAYVLDPQKDFSKTLVTFIKHRDFRNLAKFIHYHKDDIKDKALNSAIFQVVFALFAIMVVSTSTSYFVKALILSTYASLMYKLLENYYEGRVEEWFWAFKNKPEKHGVYAFFGMVLIVFVYCLGMF